MNKTAMPDPEPKPAANDETPPVAPNETATLVYEQEPRIAGVWIETREVQPAAAPRGER